MTTEKTPELILIGIAFLLICGFATLIWGRRLPRSGDWLSAFGLAALAGVLAFSLTSISTTPGDVLAWHRGWIWPREEATSITIGVLQDALGLLSSTLAILLAVFLLVNQRTFGADGGPGLTGGPSDASANGPHRKERFFSAAAISTAGVALSWLSLTAWTGFAGMLLAIVGGFLAMGSKWDDPQEADLAIRYAWYRAWGLGFSGLGAMILASLGASLVWNEAWNLSRGASWIATGGAALLTFGIFLQLLPCVFSGWVVSKSALSSPVRIALTQVFPAWAAFGILMRAEPTLRSLQVFPAMAWIALASSLASVIAGFFQEEWSSISGTWLSAAFSVCFALLGFAGPATAIGPMFGIGLGAVALATVSAALEVGGPASHPNRQRAVWAKVTIFGAGAAASGFAGFCSVQGFVGAIGQKWPDPEVAAALVASTFILSLLLWRLCFRASILKNYTQASWVSIVSPLVLVLLTLGVFWTGTVTGGLFAHGEDRLFPGVSEFLFAKDNIAAGTEAFSTATLIHLSLLVLAFIISFWTSSKDADKWLGVSRSSPAMNRVIESGYGATPLFSNLRKGFSWIGTQCELWLDQKLWMNWLPEAMVSGLRAIGRFSAAADLRVSSWMESALRVSVEVPAKTMQLIQNGDVQWYLFFAISSGIAIFIKFWKV